MTLVYRQGIVRGAKLLALIMALVCIACVLCIRGGLSGGTGEPAIDGALDESVPPDSTSPDAHANGQEPDGTFDGESSRLLGGGGWVRDLLAGGGATAREQEGSVEEVAASVLSSYRDRGDCVLASSGYLDLLGSVWSCVIRGGSWADVCIVSGDEDANRCQVIVLRIEQDEVLRLLEEEGSHE